MSVATMSKSEECAADYQRRFDDPAQYLTEGTGLATIPKLVGDVHRRDRHERAAPRPEHRP